MRENPIPIPLPVQGVIRSVDVEHIPPTAAREMENLVYRDGQFSTRPGVTVFADNIKAPNAILQAPDNGLWQLGVTPEGAPFTTSVGSGIPQAIVLVDNADGVSKWLLGVTNAGVLTVTGTSAALSKVLILRASDLSRWRVIITSGAIEQISGSYSAQRPAGFASYDSQGLRRLVLGTNRGWWAYDESLQIWQEISGNNPLTAGNEQVVFRTFEKSGMTWLLGVNGVDNPKKWNGNFATPYQDIMGSPPISRCLLVLNDRALLLNLKSGDTISPAAIAVSNDLDFDSGWSTQEITILSGGSEIVSSLELGSGQTDIGAIHCKTGIWLAIPQDDIAPFRFPPAVRYEEGDGPASTRATTNTRGSRQIILSANGTIHSFDGATWDLVWPEASIYIRKTANIAALNRAWVAYDHVYDDVLFVYPEVGNFDPTLGILVNSAGRCFPVRWTGKNMTAGLMGRSTTGIRMRDLTQPMRAISQTWGDLGNSGLIRSLILGEVGGQVYEEVGENDDGNPVNFLLESGLYLLGAGNFFTVKRLEHRFDKANSPQVVTVKIGKSGYGENRVLSSGHDLDVGKIGPYLTGHRIDSKALSVRIEGAAMEQVVWRGSWVKGYAKRGQR